MLKLHYTIVFISLILLSCSYNKQSNTSSSANGYVNAFIGTGGHGHTYPGAQMPFGMVQLSPDNGQSGWDWVSGYHYSDSVIVGFSHTHLSGAGIGDLTDISVMPTTVNIDIEQAYGNRLDKPYADFYTHNDEVASPGYYSVKLRNSGIKAELTTSKRTGFHRYTFNKDGERNILLDLGYAQNWDSPTETEIEMVDDHTVIGKRFSTGWANDQRLFFCISLSAPVQSAVASSTTDLLKAGKVTSPMARALFKFKPGLDQIMVKVALSSVSAEGAMQNMQAENSKWDFDHIRHNAAMAWSDELEAIKVKSADKDKKVVFYSSLYRAKLAPTLFSDVDKKYRGADIEVHQTDGFNYYTGLSLWDTFRAQNPLLTITNPDIAVDIAKTMLAHYDETGTLPVWVLAANETNTMTGYHSVSILAEIIMKGLGDFDYEKAYQAMKNTMLQDQRGLKELREHGYVPFDLMDESVTIALELAYNDYGVAMVAQKLGHQDDYAYFSKRSMVYRKIFDKETGFMRGKNSKGQWRTPFDPKHSAHRKGTDYTEGNAWQHSWFVLHDIQGLVEAFGSTDAFEKQLTQLFNESSEITGDNASPDITGLIGQYAHGNEPSHHIAYMYNYIGQPWKTQELVHRIMQEQYPNSPDGISGNEDMGQMSAWYAMSALGFYPVNPTDGNFIIGTPLFEEAVISVGAGKHFSIIANNLTDNNYYIQSATLNGQELTRSYIRYEEIMNGGTLQFEMGSRPNKDWATGLEARPPSLSQNNGSN